MSQSLNKAARMADGRSHRCQNCPLHPCTDTQYKVCGDAFVEGFMKGAKFKKEQIKRNNQKQYEKDSKKD